jgi:predicted RNA-binding protein with TRAM domain
MFRRRGNFRGPRRQPDLPKPVEVGKEYNVEIAEVGAKGDGIARINNFVIFVPNTKQGEKVKIKINSIGRSFAIAEKVSSASTESEESEEEEEAPEEESVSEESEDLEEDEEGEE